jgi:diaminohydroxyphosphoribosylaminopyrimidine deaminase/5-amino-6-(5-phosphoribosylamino)uracil reductase
LNGKYFLDIASIEAWKYQLLTYPNPAVGSVITDQNDNIISIGSHQKAGFDHAELDACKKAYEKLTNIKIESSNSHESSNFLYANHNELFKNLNIYVTLEPCSHEGKTPSCAKLLKNLGFKNIIIGQKDTNIIAKDGAKILKNQNVTFIDHRLSQDLLYPFKRWQKERFVFFKIALNKNYTYDTGIISNKSSRKLVHNYRELIDLLVIGGESVRVDRPTLDTRLASNTNPPNILIYSRHREFDQTIPLFNIKDREVTITNNLPKDKKFIMIEGGANLFDKIQHLCDWLIVFQSPNDRNGSVFKIPENSNLLHQREIESDMLKFYSIS